MSFNPKVSIIVPVYNGSIFLKDAIDSALGQTYHNIEVIVINDGSNDGGKTEAIARSYGDRIRYFYKRNGGVATALNLGIRKMTGEYFSWLSHDDLYLPDKVERQIYFLSKSKTTDFILYSDFEALDLRNNSSHICRIDHTDSGDKIYDILYLLFKSVIHGCTLLLPKACFDNVGLFNENLRTTQDYELWFKLVKEGYQFKHVPEILIKTRWHKDQGTSSMTDIHFREVENLLIWAFDLFHENFQSFSFSQIEKFVIALRNRTLKKSPHYIFSSWWGKRPSRLILTFLIEFKRLRSNIIEKAILIFYNCKKKVIENFR